MLFYENMQITLKIKDQNNACFIFFNFSVTNTSIFMKFYTQAKKKAINYLRNFCTDPCTHKRARGKTRVRVRRKFVHANVFVRTRVFSSWAYFCAQTFTKKFFLLHCYLMSLGVKFHNEWSIRYGEI